LAWIFLAFAVSAEVLGTSLLGSTDGFTRPLPSLLVALCYGVSIFLLAQAVQDLPVGLCYAIWAGVGTATVAAIGALFLGDPLNAAAVAGIVLILAGVVTLNLSGAH